MRAVELSVVGVERPEQIAPAIDAAKASGAEAVNVLASPLWYSSRRTIFERMAATRLPAIYQWVEMADEGASRLGPRPHPDLPRVCAGWSPRYCAAPSPPTSRSSSRPISSW